MPGSARMDGRNGEIYRRVAIYGWTHERTAEHFGISRQRVDQIVAAVRAEMKPLIAEDMRRDSLEFLQDMKARALEIADLVAAPVAVGKDGTILTDIDPVTGEEYTVRDYSGRLAAMQTAAKMDAEMAKRFGLNAPDKVETTATVKYEIANVPVEDLT